LLAALYCLLFSKVRSLKEGEWVLAVRVADKTYRSWPNFGRPREFRWAESLYPVPRRTPWRGDPCTAGRWWLWRNGQG
jgi:hypothetical protein